MVRLDVVACLLMCKRGDMKRGGQGNGMGAMVKGMAVPDDEKGEEMFS